MSTASLILLTLLSAGPAAAQGPADLRSSEVEAEEQADLLLIQAREHDAAGNWLMAALAYEGSGKLRTARDPRRVEEFALAAAAYKAGGFSEEAVGMSVEAGRNAQDQGEAVRAAESFRNAAFLSAEMGKSRRASDYALRACSVVEEGSLAASERRDALIRLGCPLPR